MLEFPDSFDEAIKKVALTNKVVLRKDSHYDAIDRELQWFEARLLKRIYFSLGESSIDVTFYINRFSKNPKTALMFYHLLPTIFKYPAQIEWEPFKSLPMNKSSEFYYNKILNYINDALKNNGPLQKSR